MTFRELEDEAPNGTLYTYAEWRCFDCFHTVNDMEDEFRYPEEGGTDA